MLLAVLGGFCSGIYPVPIKAKRVVVLRAHPVVFQAYKSAWVLLTGILLVVCNSAAEFVWSECAALSAACWIPAGLLTIYAVPIIGVGPTVVLNSATSAATSFLFFWLLAPEQGTSIRMRKLWGHDYALAPFYLIALIVGMVALVAVPRVKLPCAETQGQQARARALRVDVESAGALRFKELESPQVHFVEVATFGFDDEDVASSTRRRHAADADEARAVEFDKKRHVPRHLPQSSTRGVVSAVGAGICGAGRWAVVELGKRRDRRRLAASLIAAGADARAAAAARSRFAEMWNPLGSFSLSFGTGAAVVTAVCFGVVAILRHQSGKRPPKLHAKQLSLPASVASWFWVAGALLKTYAVERSGDIVAVPIMTTSCLITSGFIGLVYYGEMQSKWHGALWCIAAAWTVAAMLLLCGERVVLPGAV